MAGKLRVEKIIRFADDESAVVVMKAADEDSVVTVEVKVHDSRDDADIISRALIRALQELQKTAEATAT